MINQKIRNIHDVLSLNVIHTPSAHFRNVFEFWRCGCCLRQSVMWHKCPPISARQKITRVLTSVQPGTIESHEEGKPGFRKHNDNNVINCLSVRTLFAILSRTYAKYHIDVSVISLLCLPTKTLNIKHSAADVNRLGPGTVKVRCTTVTLISFHQISRNDFY